MLAKQAKQNINNAFYRIEELKRELCFTGFGDNLPEILVNNNIDEYDISLWWNDVIFDIEDVIISLEKNGEITPSALMNLLNNINN